MKLETTAWITIGLVSFVELWFLFRLYYLALVNVSKTKGYHANCFRLLTCCCCSKAQFSRIVEVEEQDESALDDVVWTEIVPPVEPTYSLCGHDIAINKLVEMKDVPKPVVYEPRLSEELWHNYTYPDYDKLSVSDFLEMIYLDAIQVDLKSESDVKPQTPRLSFDSIIPDHVPGPRDEGRPTYMVIDSDPEDDFPLN